MLPLVRPRKSRRTPQKPQIVLVVFILYILPILLNCASCDEFDGRLIGHPPRRRRNSLVGSMPRDGCGAAGRGTAGVGVPLRGALSEARQSSTGRFDVSSVDARS